LAFFGFFVDYFGFAAEFMTLFTAQKWRDAARTRSRRPDPAGNTIFCDPAAVDLVRTTKTLVPTCSPNVPMLQEP
jgi:hypothetical protein